MIGPEQLARINELARKAKGAEGLTQEETEERAALRQAYLASVRASLTAQLDSVHFVDECGNRQPLRRKAEE